jgi:hypothetical protein
MSFEGCGGCEGFEAFEGFVKFVEFVQFEGEVSKQVNRLRSQAEVVN